jgi:hypothetical protein
VKENCQTSLFSAVDERERSIRILGSFAYRNCPVGACRSLDGPQIRSTRDSLEKISTSVRIEIGSPACDPLLDHLSYPWSCDTDINPLQIEFILNNTAYKIKAIPHRKHITPSLQRSAG